MSGEAKKNNEKARRSIFKMIRKGILKTVLFLLAFVVIVSLSFIFLSQTSVFRGWFYGLVLEKINENLDGRIEAADIKISPFEGLKIRDLRIISAGDTLAFVKKITVRYSFTPLFDNYLYIKSVTIDNPKIKLLRNGIDSTWNFEHLIKPSSDTSAGGKLDWVFDLKNLTLINGKIKIEDELSGISVPGHFNLSHSDFKNINISLRAKADFKNQKFSAELNKFLLYEKHSKLDIKEFYMQVKLDSSGVFMDNARLRTNYATAKLNIALTKFNPLGKIDKTSLDNAHFDITFDAEYFSLLILNKFADNFPEINDDIQLYARISGNTNRLDVKKIKIKDDDSRLLITGFANELLDSNKLNYKINIINSDLYDKDFRAIKNAFDLSQLNIGHTKIKKIEGRGGANEPLNVSLDLNSSFGELNGDAQINLKDMSGYYAELDFKNVNPGYLLNDKSMQSDLSGSINLKGNGLTPEHINADLALSLNNSKFTEFRIDDMLLKTRIDSNMKIKIDTFMLALQNVFSDSLIHKYSEQSTIMTSGRIDFSDAALPEYNFDIELREFNLASLLKSYLMPQYLDSKIKVSGKGFHPDSLEAVVNAAIDNCMFGNRALMPFNIDVTVERFFGNGRQILISSQLFDVELNGEYQLEDFGYFAGMQIGELVGFIDRKVNTFNYEMKRTNDSLGLRFDRRKIPKFKNFTMDLTASLHDLTPIGIAVGQPYLSGNADIEVYIDAVDNRTVIDMKKLSVNDFQYEDSKVKIVVNPTDISARLDLVLEDSLSRFENINLSLLGKTSSFIDEMEFNQPKIYCNYHNDSVVVDLNLAMNDFIRMKTKGNLLLHTGHFALVLDSTNVALENFYSWNSLEPIHLILSDKGLEFEKFIFHRSNFEKISISGTTNSVEADNINIEVKNFPLNQLSTFLTGTEKKFAKSLKGKLNNLMLTLNDSLNSPDITLNFETSDMFSDKRYLGILKGKADYVNKLLEGGLKLVDSTGRSEMLHANINSFPIDLALKTGGKRILGGRPIDIQIRANNLPLDIVNPFLPDDIKDMTGSADIEFDILGVKDSVEYTGFILAKRAHFLSKANNLYYNASGKINIHNEDITFNKLKIENDSKDLKASRAYVNGSLIFKNFEIGKFDFNIKAKRLKLLGMASQRSMPGLYGDFVIATRNKGIIFSGDFAHPSIAGDLEILRARLYMPTTESKTHIMSSRFKYEIKGNNIKVENISKDSLLSALFNASMRDTSDTETEEKTNKNETKSFSDLLKYDLNIWFFMPMQINMDIGAQLGQMTAIVSTRIPSSPIHYYVDPEKNTAKIIGDLVLKKNSVFNYVKPFSITGDIVFPTGDIDNPRLNLKAEYHGRTTVEDKSRNYTVILYIRGTQKRPLIVFDYTIDNEAAKGDSTKIREDALFLLMFGLTKTEFENPTNSGAGGFTDIGAQSIASMLSRSVTEMLSGTGFITSADIDLQGGSFQNAKLKLSGQLLGMTWKVGGTIADVMNGYEFTAEVPLGLLLFPDKFRSLFLTFMTSYNPSQNVSRNQKNWEIMLKFGDEF
jgi:hypothetical protein